MTIQVSSASGKYSVHFGPFEEMGKIVSRYVPGERRYFLVTDENVDRLYGDVVAENLANASTLEQFVLPAGEATKSLSNVQALYDWALSKSVERDSVVVALGGGVIGDIGGFFAATILRGVSLIHVPTTVTAQVDSSIGGKTGINHEVGKNLIGSFYPPKLIYTDVQCLTTLPRRELLSGLSEVVKHGYLAGSPGNQLNEDVLEILDGKPIHVDTIRSAAKIKTDVVSADEYESNRRAYLNFGHTFGHAIEKATSYSTFTHGEAVAVGMRIALDWSIQRGANVSTSTVDRLLDEMSLDYTRLPAIDSMLEAMTRDKKSLGGRPRFVLLDSSGRPGLVDQYSMHELRQVMETSLGNLG